jgi:hypothetical protein
MLQIIRKGRVKDRQLEALVAVKLEQGQPRGRYANPNPLNFTETFYAVQRRLAQPHEVSAPVVHVMNVSSGDEIEIRPQVTVLGVVEGGLLRAAEQFHHHYDSQERGCFRKSRACSPTM